MNAGACLTLITVCRFVPLSTSGFCISMPAEGFVKEEVYFGLHLKSGRVMSMILESSGPPVKVSCCFTA